ncbi:branched-chain amino acid ABC transporter ATP-binding protein/permease [Pusillimonas sp. CC-YST705]|uniref:Branched-chain amino acid ABC transporter ATP-binding protein/permease n=1 Tax=Mesopusillimonas faecipullorum TaxID=2755040 RepID=A0ABS8CFG6_9BURK|nr:branched-chain amino acid ABC transporter ATP-binding protein/permease [Mesopusillimonas faecipullorum]MCB5364780.1 branched-chain amino acid ABC transporter ATP-binding protein/permease [Mesopusillimonas faecipullorum]
MSATSRRYINHLPWLILAAAAFVPVLGSSYAVSFTFTLLSALVLAQSWDWLGGKTGYTNLGHFAFFGTGAYSFAISASAGLGLIPSLALAALVPMLLALVLAFPLFRLRGNYFAFATLALIPLFELLALNLVGLTQGANGIALTIPRDMGMLYGLVLALGGISIGVSVWLDHSRFGYALKAIRNDEQAAETCGIRILPAKMAVFALGALFAGLAGALQAWFLGYIDPHTVFGLDVALGPIAMALFGGSGLLWGPLLGVIILGTLHNYLITNLSVLQTAAYGLLILLIGRYMPGGMLRSIWVSRLPLLSHYSREHHEQPQVAGQLPQDPAPIETVPATAVLSSQGAIKRFGGNTAVNSVTLEVQPGDVIGLVGPNGSGKTTFFNCVSRVYTLDGGRISFAGVDLADKRRDQVAHLGIGRTYQIPRPFSDLSTLENIAVALMFRAHHPLHHAQALRVAHSYAAQVGLGGKTATLAQDLSLQDRKLLELARALASRPRLLLVDEVASGLTPAEIASFVELLKTARDTYGLSIIWVEHIFWALAKIVDRVVVLEQGSLLAQGSVNDIVHDPKVIEAYFGAKGAEKEGK